MIRWAVQVMYRSHLDDHPSGTIPGWECSIEEVQAAREDDARAIALARNPWPGAHVASSWPADSPPQLRAGIGG